MQVYQVRAPGLRSEFPPLRSVDEFPGNLPVQLTSFIGRGAELAGIAEALDAWRMVTVTGVGGVGKTRLAVQVAADVLPRFRDGAWMCELAVAHDEETMGQVIAAELGVSQRVGMSLAESVSNYLRPKELLLMLDNCEHLLGPATAFVVRVLRECAGVRILATSREALGVVGEHVWPLQSLPLPDPAGSGLVTNDAVVLFTERAEAMRTTFALDESNAAAVAEICRRLDGIPLAIELAAARVVSMSPSEISGLLGERFRLLTGGRRSAIERQQTLRATVDWSYSLLGEQERTAFHRLGVFAGSFDTRAAQAVVGDDGVDAWDVLDSLTELVAKSMIVAEETAGGTTRYQMLETLGQYARERLDERGETDGWRRRHAEYFAAWAEEAGPGLVGPEDLAWRRHVYAELDNLRVAVNWALDRDDPDDVSLGVRIIGALAFVGPSDPVTGLAAWADRALPHVNDASPQLRYAVTAAAAFHQQSLGNYEQAAELARRAIGDGVPPGSPAPLTAYLILGTTSQVHGDPERALAIVLEAVPGLERDFPGSVFVAGAHGSISIAASESRNPIARTEAEVALRQARSTGNASAIASALMALGWALIADDPAASLALLDEAIALCREGASPLTIGPTLCLSAGLRVRSGDLPHAARDLREAIDRCHQTGARLTLYSAVVWGIHVLVRLGRLEEAAAFDGIASTGLTPEYRARSRWARLDRTIASARAAYGPEQYDRAFESGAAMSYDQAVEYGLHVLDGAIDELAERDDLHEN
jgi:predicted ATPase